MLKIASWNVRNYLITDRVVDDSYRRGYPKPEIEKTALRQVLQEVDADVVLLQEMGSDPFLLELQRDLRTEGLEYAYSTVLRADDEDRHLAVLSRVPFEMLEHERELDFKYFNRREVVKRGLMELVFETEGNPWTLYNLHLKSRYTDVKEDPESAKRRTAEATRRRPAKPRTKDRRNDVCCLLSTKQRPFLARIGRSQSCTGKPPLLSNIGGLVRRLVRRLVGGQGGHTPK